VSALVQIVALIFVGGALAGGSLVWWIWERRMERGWISGPRLTGNEYKPGTTPAEWD
jgi:hypothetical protein